MRRAIRDVDRREALILQVRCGLSIEEIAAATGATESAVEWRLRMAKKDLEDDDDKKKKKEDEPGVPPVDDDEDDFGETMPVASGA